MSGNTLHVHQGNPIFARGVSNQSQPAGNTGKTLPYTALVGSTGADSLDLTNQQAQGVIDQIQTVFIDNRLNLDIFLLTTSTGQVVACPPFSQGWFPLFSSNPPKFDFASAGGVNVPLWFGNMPMPVGVWDVNPGAVESSGAAAFAIVTNSVPVVVFVSSSGIAGGFITNPIAATESLYVDWVNVPAVASPGASGTTIQLVAGQSVALPPGLRNEVQAVAATAGHAFVAVQW